MAEQEDISIVKEMHRLLDERPFRPFTIVMDSGHRYEVTGRHSMAIGRSVAVLMAGESPSIHLRINSISSIENSPEQSAA